MAPDPEPDQLLMQRIQAGDEHAFEVLVHTYQGLVLSLCRRYLGSRAARVEDVAQEVFVRIYRGRHGYEPRARVKTWIYSITVNACLNEIRRLKSRKNQSVSTFTAVFGDSEDARADVTACEAEDAGAAIDVESASRRIRAAVDALPEQQRLALVLARYHHCSYVEIANTMETTVPAVKSLLTRARTHLKTSLRDLVEGERFKMPAPPLEAASPRPTQVDPADRYPS